MALTAGTVKRMTHNMSGSLTKAAATTFSVSGQRMLIARIQLHFSATPTNAASVLIGQTGNTTYDTVIMTTVAGAVDFIAVRSGQSYPPPTLYVPMESLILEGDEQLWFTWTRVAETGTLGIVVQAIPVSQG